MQKGNKSLIKKIYSKQIIFTIIGLVIIVLISIPLAKNVSKLYKVNQEVDNFKIEIKNLGSKNSQLNNLISYLESDQYIENEARLNLNLKKPGETVYAINNKDEEENASTKNSNIDSIQTSPSLDMNNSHEVTNLSRWINYFFNK
jgi:cell division protein FtsB